VSAPPSSLRNLGPATDRWLREIGVQSAEALRELGSVEAWRRLRFRFGREVNLVLLYALDGALSGHGWRRLPPGRREALRAAARDTAR